VTVGGEAPVTPVLSLDSSSLDLSYKPCDNKAKAILQYIARGNAYFKEEGRMKRVKIESKFGVGA